MQYEALPRSLADQSSMTRRHFVFAAVWSLLFVLAACSPDPSGKTLSFDASKKVCQLTGETDWDTGEATTARTQSAFGFVGTDLGYPVEHNNRMALFFGDSRFEPPRKVDASYPESGPPDDAIGWVSTHTPPTKDRCLDLTINPKSPAVGPPTINQGLFNVPTGGVSSNGLLYGFFWTDHCLEEKKCPGSDKLNEVGPGFLARSKDDGMTFVDPVAMPSDFVYSTAFDSEAAADLPPEQRIGTYVFGVPRYRHSVPYLAYAPAGRLADPSAWQFFVGRKPDGQPRWVTNAVWNGNTGGLSSLSPPGQPELFAASEKDRCVGEFSVTWNRALHVWLLMYQNCNPSGLGGQVVVVRVAAAPWGPWSDASILLDPNRDNPWCHLLWQVPRDCVKLRAKVGNSEENIADLKNKINDATGALKQRLAGQLTLALAQLTREKEALVNCEKAPPPPPPPGGVSGCDDRHKDDWINDAEKAGNQNGDFYAPYVMERYTTPERTFLPYRKRATIYWLLSTWNPYQVVVMKTSLTVDESWPTIRSVLDRRSIE